MKRTRGDDPITSSPGEPAKVLRPKRPKSSLACLTCRKSKARCEPGADKSSRRCHRCTSLFLSCSFDEEGAPVPSASVGPDVALSLPRSASGTPAYTPPEQPPFDGRSLKVEDLITWETGDDEIAHWSTAPMAAMDELIHRRWVPSELSQPTLLSDDALVIEQIPYLLSIFDAHYTPWLNLPYTYSEHATGLSPLDDFLTVACCAIAARHLPTPARSFVLPRLQKQAEHATLVHLFRPTDRASLGAVQALVIVALWAPAVGPLESEVKDSGKIASAAASMAMTLNLDKDAAKWAQIEERQLQGALTPNERRENDVLGFKARLWALVCSVEWLLTMGSGHDSVSSIPPDDFQRLRNRLVLGSMQSGRNFRDMRLGIGLRILHSAHRATKLRIADLPSFAREIDAAFRETAGARSCILPLIISFPQERLHMDNMLLLTYFCGLVLFFHALTEVRAYFTVTSAQEPYSTGLEGPEGSAVSRWAIMVMNSAQSILVTFFDIVERSLGFAGDLSSLVALGSSNPAPPTAPLHSAPDSVFSAILFSVSAILVNRYSAFTALDRTEGIGWFATTALLSRLGQTLEALSVSTEHAPSRTATIIRDLAGVWNKRVSRNEIVNPLAGGRRGPMDVDRTQDMSGRAINESLWLAGNSSVSPYPRPPAPTAAYRPGEMTLQESSWLPHGPSIADHNLNAFPTYMAQQPMMPNMGMIGFGRQTPGGGQLRGDMPLDEFWATFIW